MAERGSVIVSLAVLMFGGVLMLGLAVDLARVAATWREASHTASTAAEVGAGWIDEAAARQDRLELNPTRARAAANAVASAPRRTVTVEASTQRVCVRVTIPVPPSILTVVGASPAVVSARSCAEPRKG